MARSEGLDGMQVDNIRRLKIFFCFSVGHGVTVLGYGNEVYLLLKQLGEKVAKLHFPQSVQSSPSLLKDQAFQAYKSEVYRLPNQLHEIVASLHLPALGPDPERLGPERSVVMELFTLRLCSRLFSMPADKI